MAKKTSQSQEVHPFYIVANWKMNKTTREALVYVDELFSKLKRLAVTKVWLAVPFTTLSHVGKKLEGTELCVGAQNMNDASPGAFTGEIAAEMLKDEGCSFVLLGHSERRRYYHETDEYIKKKVDRAIEVGLTVILCVGETLEERNNDETEAVLHRQIESAFVALNEKDLKETSLLVAYEPVWAIGTGKTATVEMVEKAHSSIRILLQKLFPSIGSKIALLYGGSVSDKNAAELSAVENVNGFLIGTASLQPTTFANIIEISENSLCK